MTYLEESTANSYVIGVAVGNLSARSVPEIVVVPLFKSVNTVALLDSGIAVPLASQANIVMAAPDEGSDPDISVIFMEFRKPMELAIKLADKDLQGNVNRIHIKRNIMIQP